LDNLRGRGSSRVKIENDLKLVDESLFCAAQVTKVLNESKIENAEDSDGAGAGATASASGDSKEEESDVSNLLRKRRLEHFDSREKF
jgi:hypothetical protein